LRALGEKQVEKFMKGQLNKPLKVLVEKDNRGHSEHYLPVTFSESQPEGAIVDATIVSIESGICKAVTQ